MTRENAISRRTALKVTGAAAATALVAGCSDDDDGNGNGNGNGDDDGGNDDGGNGDGVNIEPDTEIELDAQTGGWEGVAPDDIDGEQNPTLILEEGETYEIGWNQGDGGQHNIEIWDEDDELVEDYETETTTDEEPEDQWLEFEASEEMAYYVCEPHQAQMRGEIQVE